MKCTEKKEDAETVIRLKKQGHTETREAKFVYNVKLRSGKDVVTTDTLYIFFGYFKT